MKPTRHIARCGDIFLGLNIDWTKRQETDQKQILTWIPCHVIGNTDIVHPLISIFQLLIHPIAIDCIQNPINYQLIA